MNISKENTKNIKIGVILSYISMIVSIIGSLFISNRVLNYIGDYNYGIYSFVNSITSWLSVISSALTASYIRYTTIQCKENKDGSDLTNTIYLKLLLIIGFITLVIGFLITGILYFAHINFGSYDWNDSKLMYMLAALSICNIAITMPASIYSLYINLKQKFIFLRLLGICLTIINFAGHFIIAFYTKSIVLISVFSIIQTLLSLGVSCIYSKNVIDIKFAKARLKENSTLIKSIVVFSGIILFNSLVDQINSSVDKTLLGLYASPVDVTKYQMGQQLSEYLRQMSVAVSGVFVPVIHELVAKNENEEVDRLFVRISKIQSIIVCCVAFGFLSAGKNFVIWWLGESRIEVYYCGVVLMMISLVPHTLNASIEIQRAMNKHKFRAFIYFSLAVCNILLSILFLNIFTSDYAIYACLLGTVITTFLSHWLAMNIYNKKEIHLSVGKYMLTLFAYILIGIISYGIVYLLDCLWIESISSVLIKFMMEGVFFIFIYLLFSFLLNKKQCIEFLKRKLKRS